MFNFFKKKNTSVFKFSEPENTACFICDHVFHKQRPILSAIHDGDDGSWQFLCGQDDHTGASIKIVSLKQATEIDPTINDLYTVPPGFRAERNDSGLKWNTSKE